MHYIPQASQSVELKLYCRLADKSGTICDYGCERFPTLKVHLQRVHGINDLKCDKCGEEFPRWSGLYQHRDTCTEHRLSFEEGRADNQSCSPDFLGCRRQVFVIVRDTIQLLQRMLESLKRKQRSVYQSQETVG